TAGVTDINASGAASASSGLEGLLPYADALFDPAATSVKVMVMMVLPNGTVGNQILPGLGGGVGLPGLSPDFRATPGDQFAVVSLIVPGDFNGDRLFNLADYSFFDDCLTGPAAPGGLGAGCEVFDFVADTAIDLRDFQAVQQRL
ncbi:MAG: hypothetical protein ACE5GE_14865, partial [Phycisphaerae bacterium]